MGTASAREYFIIVAAGTGSRFGASVPKQYCSLAGEPVLIHTLRNISRIRPSAIQILVISREMENFWLELCRQYGFTSPRYVFGGATRFHSVKTAIGSLEGIASDIDAVYIHDAARPLIDAAVIERLAEAINSDSTPGAIPVVPLSDSIRQLNNDGTSRAADRSMFRAVQTPQAFRYSFLRSAYDQEFDPLFTDDASVVERFFRQPVALVDGAAQTIKITNARDMAIVEALL